MIEWKETFKKEPPPLFSGLTTGQLVMPLAVTRDLPWRSIYIGATGFGLIQSYYTGKIRFEADGPTPLDRLEEIKIDHGGFSASLTDIYNPGRLIPQREVEHQFTFAASAVNFPYLEPTAPDTVLLRRRWTDSTAPNTVCDKQLELFPIRIHARVTRVILELEYQFNLEPGFTNTGYFVYFACKSSEEKV